MSNKVKFFLVNSLYSGAITLSGGTVLQIFMTNAGVSNQLIGIYTSLISIASMSVNLLYSKAADEVRNVKRASTLVYLLIAICYLGFLAPCFASDSQSLRQMTCSVLIPVGILQTLFTAALSVLDYKLPYCIMDMEEYGSTVAIQGVVTYTCCTILSVVLSYCLKHFDYILTMRWAFGASALFVVLAAFINRTYRIYNTPFAQTQKTGIIKVMITLVKMKDFNVFLLPNFLRGISMGVFDVLAMICLGLGHHDSTAAALVTVGSVANFLGYYLYYVLSKGIPERKIGFIGAFLMVPLIFTFLFGDTVFLVFALLALVGRALISIAVPASVYRIIRPDVACTYHAGRMFITTLGTAVATAFSGFLIEGGCTVLLIVIGVLTQLLSSLAYLLYKGQKINT